MGVEKEGREREIEEGAVLKGEGSKNEGWDQEKRKTRSGPEIGINMAVYAVRRFCSSFVHLIQKHGNAQ